MKPYNFQQQFSAAEEQRRADVKSSTNDLKNMSDKLFEEKKKEWDELIEEKDEAYEKLLNDTSESLKLLKDDIKSKADSMLLKIKESKDKAEELVGIITDTGMVGGYQRVANEE